MAIRGAERAVARVIAVLQASLPAELDLIDAEEGDGITLTDVDNAAYFDYEDQRVLVEHALAIVVNHTATSPIDLMSDTNSPGVYDAFHDIVVSVSMKDTGNERPSTMKKRVERYARGIERVLAIKNPTLPSGGVETVVFVTREEDSTFIQAEQEEGGYVRTATIPFRIRTRENL